MVNFKIFKEMWGLLDQIFIFYKQKAAKRIQFQWAVVALKRPNLDCFPALESINQNTITLKSSCNIQKLHWSLKYNAMVNR